MSLTVKDPRLSQVLPIIHCSDCGHDVEFRRLSEHICVATPAVPVLPLFPYTRKYRHVKNPFASQEAGLTLVTSEPAKKKKKKIVFPR